MTSEDRFKLFIARFNCCASRIKKRNLIISNVRHWNLIVDSEKVFRISNSTYTNPMSLMLEGHKISTRMFGNGPDYSTYTYDQYPYYQLDIMFGFQHDVLRTGFCTGFKADPGIRNYYDGETSIAFNLGRFFLDKYLGGKLPYTKHDYFI